MLFRKKLLIPVMSNLVAAAKDLSKPGYAGLMKHSRKTMKAINNDSIIPKINYQLMSFKVLAKLEGNIKKIEITTAQNHPNGFVKRKGAFGK